MFFSSSCDSKSCYEFGLSVVSLSSSSSFFVFSTTFPSLKSSSTLVFPTSMRLLLLLSLFGVGGCVADVSVDDGTICGEDVGVFILGVMNVLSLVSSEDTGTNLVPCMYLNGLLPPK